MSNLHELFYAKNISMKMIASLDISSLSEELQNCNQAKRIVWHLFYNINTAMKCSCGSYLQWVGRDINYRTFCSIKCARNSDDVKNKQVATNLKRYGVPSPLQNNEIKQKLVETNMTRYGVRNPGLMSDHMDKVKVTSNKKFGADHIMHTPVGKNNHRAALMTKYNVTNAKLVGKDIGMMDQFNDDNIFFDVYSRYSTVLEVAEYFGYTATPIQTRARSLGLPLKNSHRSYGEIEMANFIESLGVSIIESDRNIISPYELDIYIPTNNMAIEFNGLYWHSSRFIADKCYHVKKTERCLAANVNLIQFYDYEWKDKQAIVKSMIRSRLKQSPSVIGARECTIVELTAAEQFSFFDENHLQGAVNAKVAYGLKAGDDIMAAMSFGRPRYNKNYVWELLRLAVKVDYNVPGGASKLFSYFINNHQGSIISYANRRFSQGNIYNMLGFNFIKNTAPNYFYLVNGKVQSRSNYQKHKLKDKIDTFDDKLTEQQNMANNGFYPTYDAGNQYWEYKGN